jgi:asparagine synthase (glutamine-hydrolysing)
MCGITGKVWFDAERPGDAETVARMTATLVHRGPDDGGVAVSGSAALGHRRLSIIDLAGGHQPVANEDGRYQLVFNGEIYNYRELMAGLKLRGHRFASRCDAETIVHLYEEKGPACVSDLRGMFAFAIWDSRERSLFLAHDRVGKKPLYWAMTADALLFGSEMKALLADDSVERRLDPQALSSYLTYQYVPAPGTIFQGIEKLEPASWVLVSFAGGKATVRRERYWQLSYEPKTRFEEGEAREAVVRHLDEAVQVRLESEVPLGILLSGGVDSSAVVAMARRHIAGPLRTFSIGFREETHNELPYARMVAERYATEHEEFIVEPDAIEVLPDLVWHFDEPFADSSALPTYYLSRMTRRHVTVALNGDGGDESFAGYERYRGLPIVRKFERIPRALRARLVSPIAGAGARLMPRNAFFEKLAMLNEISLADFERHYLAYLTIFHARMKNRLVATNGAGMHPDAIDWTLGEMRKSDARAEIDRMMACDVATYLPGALLVKADRMAMAASLEGRSPFLDHKLMEFAARLPAEIKAPGGELKGLLKRALEPHLPREVLYRPKQGFGVPLDDWFRGKLNAYLKDQLLSERARARGFFRMGYVERLIDEQTTGRSRHAHRLWTLLMFELWAQRFMDEFGAAKASLNLSKFVGAKS